MKARYDRKALKREFFDSDIDEVKVFIEAKFGQGKWNGTINKNTRGRGKEKQEHKSKLLEGALEKKLKEEIDSLTIPVEQLLKAKKTVLGLVMKKLKQVIESEDINIKDQEKILKMIKTELGEPTNISKTDATIRGEPLDENLFIQD